MAIFIWSDRSDKAVSFHPGSTLAKALLSVSLWSSFIPSPLSWYPGNGRRTIKRILQFRVEQGCRCINLQTIGQTVALYERAKYYAIQVSVNEKLSIRNNRSIY